MVEEPFQVVKEQMAAGTAAPSLARQLLEDKNVTPEEEYDIKWAASSVYAGIYVVVLSPSIVPLYRGCRHYRVCHLWLFPGHKYDRKLLASDHRC